MRNTPSLRLLRAASLGSGVASRAGAVTGQLASLSNQFEAIRRRKVLEDLLSTKRISPAQLSQGDRVLLSSSDVPSTHKPIQPGGGGGLLGQVGGFFGHLGSDVGRALEGLPQGVFNTGRALWQDVTDPHTQITDPRFPHTEKEVIKPILQSYGQYYGGGPRQFLRNFYQHPLQPVLDVGTLLSLGAGAPAKLGSLAVRAGGEGSGLADVGERLAQFNARAGRSPVLITPDVAQGYHGFTASSIPREYSASPLRRLAIQRPLDRAIGEGALGRMPIGRGRTLNQLSQQRAINRMLDLSRGHGAQEVAQAIGREGSPLAETLRHLDYHEQEALSLLMRGINAQPLASGGTLLERAQELWRKSLAGENPPESEFNIVNYPGAQAQAEHLANLPPEVAHLVQHPTPAMRGAADAWRAYVERDLGAEGRLGVTPEEHLQRSFATQSVLRGDRPAEDLAREYEQWAAQNPEQAIRPTYVPDLPAHGETFGLRGLDRVLNRVPGGQAVAGALGREMTPQLRTGPRAAISPKLVTAENIHNITEPSFLKDTDLAEFRAGAFRTDARVLLNHVAQRERHFVEQEMSRQELDRVALKDSNGEYVTAKTQHEANVKTGKPGAYVPLPPGAALTWFRSEVNLLKELQDRLETMRAEGRMTNSKALDEELAKLADHEASLTVGQFGAMKNEGILVPRSYFNRAIQHSLVNSPFSSPMARAYSRVLNLWRTATLALMPRWMINTAVGTFVQNTISGVGPRHYLTALRALRAEGRGDLEMPAGAKLGTLGSEVLEMGQGQSLARSMGPARLGFRATQGAEDFFRSASFFHRLDKNSKEAMGRTGQVLDKYRRGWGTNDMEYVKELLSDPELVHTTIEDVNQFAYNYNELGPFERRYIRQFVPFWGWYKFITKFVWRLPVNYPGRMTIINHLGDMGADYQDEFGMLPGWLRQSIFLNRSHKRLSYLPTLGLNPLSQFASPVAPEGRFSGLLRLGQFNPGIQAGLSALGIDPMTGGTVSFSPQSMVGSDFMGRQVDLRSERVLDSPAQVGGGRRFLGELMRSFPQIRIGELVNTGGRSVYPESVPFLSERPRGVAPYSRRDVGPQGLLQSYTGINPRTYNLTRAQRLNKKSVEYVKTRNKSQRRKLKYRLTH